MRAQLAPAFRFPLPSVVWWRFIFTAYKQLFLFHTTLCSSHGKIISPIPHFSQFRHAVVVFWMFYEFVCCNFTFVCPILSAATFLTKKHFLIPLCFCRQKKTISCLCQSLIGAMKEKLCIHLAKWRYILTEEWCSYTHKGSGNQSHYKTLWLWPSEHAHHRKWSVALISKKSDLVTLCYTITAQRNYGDYSGM